MLTIVAHVVKPCPCKEMLNVIREPQPEARLIGGTLDVAGPGTRSP